MLGGKILAIADTDDVLGGIVAQNPRRERDTRSVIPLFDRVPLGLRHDLVGFRGVIDDENVTTATG